MRCGRTGGKREKKQVFRAVVSIRCAAAHRYRFLVVLLAAPAAAAAAVAVADATKIIASIRSFYSILCFAYVYVYNIFERRKKNDGDGIALHVVRSLLVVLQPIHTSSSRLLLAFLVEFSSTLLSCAHAGKAEGQKRERNRSKMIFSFTSRVFRLPHKDGAANHYAACAFKY